MKKIIAALVIVSVGLASSAQTRIAVKGGFTYSTARTTDSGRKQPSSYKPGVSLGVQFDVPFDGVLHFSPYAAYNMRSYKTFFQNKQVENTIHYLDLVPALSLALPAGENKVAIGFGPVFGFTSFGHQKVTANGVTTSGKMTFNYAAYGLFDLGLTGNIGFHTKKWLLEAVYFHGLANTNNDESIPVNIQNRMFGLNIGYYFK